MKKVILGLYSIVCTTPVVLYLYLYGLNIPPNNGLNSLLVFFLAIFQMAFFAGFKNVVKFVKLGIK